MICQYHRLEFLFGVALAKATLRGWARRWPSIMHRICGFALIRLFPKDPETG